MPPLTGSVPNSHRLIAALGHSLTVGGVDLIAVFPSEKWDPEDRSLLVGARSVIVVGSSGQSLWKRFTAWAAEAPRARLVDDLHPLDRYVTTVLDRGDALLAQAGVRARRFEPTLACVPRLDFRRLAELSGLGSRSPIGMIIHPVYGPWWALRGAWIVERALAETPPLARPCDGCPAPCRATIPAGTEGTIAAATPAARGACVLSQHRYSDEQLDYHMRPDEGRRRLAAQFGIV